MKVEFEGCNLAARGQKKMYNNIMKSLTSLNILLHLLNSLNSSALTYLYCTYMYIRPKLEYACIALSPLSMHTMDKLERFQRKAARVCLRLSLYAPVDHAHFSVDLVFLHSTAVGISNTSFLHTPFITVIPLPTFCSRTSLHPPHLTTLYVIDDPTIYLAPVLTVTRTPLYINHFTSSSLPENIKKTHNRAN